jgi:hypothetical protein
MLSRANTPSFPLNRVCVIGDSHLAAVKLGWDAIRDDFPELELHFFGAPADHMDKLVVAEGRLAAGSDMLRKFLVKTSGGCEAIDNTYSAYLICGLRFGIAKIQRLCAGYRAESHTRDDRAPISNPCFFECVAAGLRDTFAVRAFLKLREIADAPVTIMHMPMPSDQDTDSALARVSASVDGVLIRQAFMAASEQLARELGFVLAVQPQGTLSGPLRTKAIYAQGSVRLAHGLVESHQADDYGHMNAAYGSMALRSWFISLQSQSSDGTKSDHGRRLG